MPDPEELTEDEVYDSVEEMEPDEPSDVPDGDDTIADEDRLPWEGEE